MDELLEISMKFFIWLNLNAILYIGIILFSQGVGLLEEIDSNQGSPYILVLLAMFAGGGLVSLGYLPELADNIVDTLESKAGGSAIVGIGGTIGGVIGVISMIIAVVAALVFLLFFIAMFYLFSLFALAAIIRD